MTWRPATQPLRAVLDGHTETLVRVRLHGGDTVVLVVPRIVNDTLHGSVRANETWDAAIPLSDIESVEVQRYSAGRTAVMIAAVVPL